MKSPESGGLTGAAARAPAVDVVSPLGTPTTRSGGFDRPGEQAAAANSAAPTMAQ